MDLELTAVEQERLQELGRTLFSGPLTSYNAKHLAGLPPRVALTVLEGLVAPHVAHLSDDRCHHVVVSPAATRWQRLASLHGGVQRLLTYPMLLSGLAVLPAFFVSLGWGLLALGSLGALAGTIFLLDRFGPDQTPYRLNGSTLHISNSLVLAWVERRHDELASTGARLEADRLKGLLVGVLYQRESLVTLCDDDAEDPVVREALGIVDADLTMLMEELKELEVSPKVPSEPVEKVVDPQARVLAESIIAQRAAVREVSSFE